MALKYHFTIDADPSARADIDQFMEGAKGLLMRNWEGTRLEKDEE